MEINAKTSVCGLIGNPVEHSISPLIHNALSALCNIDLVYVTFKVEKGHVKTAVDGAFALNIKGMNVTVPHKQEVLEALADIDPLAQSIGAVNTLVRTEHGYKGYNTDILGLHRSMIEEGIGIRNESVVILGAGGASRAIAFLCAKEGAKAVYVLNRTVEKAQAIADAVNAEFPGVVVAMPMAEYGNLPDTRFLCIQTTSVGLHPKDDEVVLDDETFYQKIHTGIDIIYNPYETRFMKLVKKAGGKTMNGLKMLLYQGVAAYELWNDVKISQGMADQLLTEMKKELGIND